MSDRLKANVYTQEQAEDMLAHIVAQRARWGKHYTGDDIGLHRLMDVLVALAQGESNRMAAVQEEMTLLRKQLAASGARETRWKNLYTKAIGKEPEEASDE